jgi:anhydro-N-acetylmuramic acid kinase
MRVIGLMSGTSLDGIDAALIEIDGKLEDIKWKMQAFRDTPFTEAQRSQIHDAIVSGGTDQLCRLHTDLGEWFARAVLELCTSAGVQPAAVDLIGSHGQTIWHIPPQPGQRGSTLQLGCAATIAERTGIPVVSDFRTRDMAAGGQGAPLVPWADRWLFSVSGKKRVLLNIGGIANLSWLPPRGTPTPILAFDTGPGNALLNSTMDWLTNGAEAFDRDASRASAGQIDETLLNALLAHPYFAQQPPKSTGRELFGRPFVDGILDGRPDLRERPHDLLATLTEFTVRTIADAIRRWALPRGVDEVLVTGGGARNPLIMRGLRSALAPVPVSSGDTAGVHPDAKEAIAFAALAWAHVKSVPGNVPEATGASGPRVLGTLTPGRAK